MALSTRTRRTATPDNTIEAVASPRQGTASADAEAIDGAELPQRPKELDHLFAEQSGKKVKYFTDYTKKDLALTIGDNSVSTKKQDPKTIATMASYAVSQGWTSVKVSGTEEFRREAWIEAHMRGIEVKGYKPTDPDRQEARRRAEEQGLNIKDNKIEAEPTQKIAPETVAQMVDLLKANGYVVQDREQAPPAGNAPGTPAATQEPAMGAPIGVNVQEPAATALTAEKVAQQAAEYKDRPLDVVPAHLRPVVNEDRAIAQLTEKLKEQHRQAKTADMAVHDLRRDHSQPKPLQAFGAALTGGPGALARRQAAEMDRAKAIAGRRQQDITETAAVIQTHTAKRDEAINAVLKASGQQATDPLRHEVAQGQAQTQSAPAQSPAAKARALYVDDYLRDYERGVSGKETQMKADPKIDQALDKIGRELAASGGRADLYAAATVYRERDAKEFAAAEQARSVDKRVLREGMTAAEHRAVLRANRADLSPDGKLALAAFTAKIDKEMDQLNTDRKAELKAHAAVQIAEKERREGPVTLTKEQRAQATAPATPAQEQANAKDHVAALKAHIEGSKREVSPKVIDRYDQASLKAEQAPKQAPAPKAAAPKPAPKAEAPALPKQKRVRGMRH